jgi:thiamine pyrophosphate-dependent acetolactate synthase large subunit-like protein
MWPAGRHRAKLAHPDRTVIAFAGDGGFMMTMQELETAFAIEFRS